MTTPGDGEIRGIPAAWDDIPTLVRAMGCKESTARDIEATIRLRRGMDRRPPPPGPDRPINQA